MNLDLTGTMCVPITFLTLPRNYDECDFGARVGATLLPANNSNRLISQYQQWLFKEIT